MWTKIITSAALGLLLAGCGEGVTATDGTEAESAKTTPAPATPILNTAENRAGSQPNMPIGQLDTIAADAAIASVEARLSTHLKENTSKLKFSETAPSVAQSVGGSKPPMNLDWRGAENIEHFYLVIRHLQPVTFDDVAKTGVETCQDGALYSGYGAANASLDVYVDTETGPLWNWALPYGLIVCDKGDDFDVLALPIDHSIFDGDAEKDATLSALPNDHPAFNGL